MRPWQILSVCMCLLFTSAVVVHGQGDITPPVLVEATADRLLIDTSYAPQSVTFQMYVTDDLSGVDRLGLTFNHKFGHNAARSCVEYPNPPSIDTRVECRIDFPQYSAEGRWMLASLFLRDAVGNVSSVSPLDCVEYSPGDGCIEYEYNEHATPEIRAMEIRISPEASAPDHWLYFPIVEAP